MSDLNIYCPTHGQPENSCIRCKEDDIRIKERMVMEGSIGVKVFFDEIVRDKGLRQQIEESDDLRPYDGVITEKTFIDFFKDLNKKRPYVDPTEHMSQKRKEQFNSYIAESIKKAKEDGY